MPEQQLNMHPQMGEQFAVVQIALLLKKNVYVITVTSWWAQWRLKSPASRLFSQAFYSRKHQSSASLALVRGIPRWLMNILHKGPVTRKIFPFDDVIMSNWKSRIQVFPFRFTLYRYSVWFSFTRVATWPTFVKYVICSAEVKHFYT